MKIEEIEIINQTIRQYQKLDSALYRVDEKDNFIIKSYDGSGTGCIGTERIGTESIGTERIFLTVDAELLEPFKEALRRFIFLEMIRLEEELEKLGVEV